MHVDVTLGADGLISCPFDVSSGSNSGWLVHWENRRREGLKDKKKKLDPAVEAFNKGKSRMESIKRVGRWVGGCLAFGPFGRGVSCLYIGLAWR